MGCGMLAAPGEEHKVPFFIFFQRMSGKQSFLGLEEVEKIHGMIMDDYHLS